MFISLTSVMIIFDNYVEYIGKIFAIVEDCTTSKLAVICDFNAAVKTLHLKQN